MFQDLSATDLMTLIEANLIERSLFIPHFFGGKIHGPNPVWFITGPAMPMANGVVSAVLARTKIDASIEATLQPFKAQNLALKWWVGPSSSPQNLGYYLQKHGLTHNRDMMGMAMDLHQLPESTPLPGLTLERVRDKETMAQWYDLFIEGFPVSFSQTYLDTLTMTSLAPDAAERHYVARFKGRIVSISTLFLGGSVAGLYNLTTRKKAQGQGIGTWVTIKTFQEALALGHVVGTLQTTYPNALRLYHRLGFEVYCKIGIYQYVPGGNPS